MPDPHNEGVASGHELSDARARVAAEDPDGLDGVAGLLRRVCRSLMADLSGMGVAISLMSSDGSVGVAAASDENSRAADELQFAAGEGPCHDAYAVRRPVLTPDLRGTDGARWPGFTSMALSSGVAAVFAFPLHTGAVAFGVMDVFSTRPGSLTVQQQNRALTYAQIATAILLDGDMLTATGDLDRSLSTALDSRAEIHQAQGMTMVDLAVGPAEALSRMRAHAFAHGKTLADLAQEIIDGYSLSDEDVR